MIHKPTNETDPDKILISVSKDLVRMRNMIFKKFWDSRDSRRFQSAAVALSDASIELSLTNGDAFRRAILRFKSEINYIIQIRYIWTATKNRIQILRNQVDHALEIIYA